MTAHHFVYWNSLCNWWKGWYRSHLKLMQQTHYRISDPASITRAIRCYWTWRESGLCQRIPEQYSVPVILLRGANVAGWKDQLHEPSYDRTRHREQRVTLILVDIAECWTTGSTSEGSPMILLWCLTICFQGGHIDMYKNKCIIMHWKIYNSQN